MTLLGTANDIEVTQQLDYYPFGLQQQGDGLFHSQQEPDNRYRFNGIEHNEETGLDFTPFRLYDAAIGRWNRIDPLARFAASWNPYRFGFNNPIKFSDASGLMENSTNPGEGNRVVDRDENGTPYQVRVGSGSEDGSSRQTTNYILPTQGGTGSHNSSNQSLSNCKNCPSLGIVQASYRGYTQFSIIGATYSGSLGIAISYDRNTDSWEYGVFTSFSIGLFEGISGFQTSIGVSLGSGSLNDVRGSGYGVGAIWGSYGGVEVSGPLGGGDNDIESMSLSGIGTPGKSYGVGGGVYGEYTATAFLKRSGDRNDIIDYIFSYSPRTLGGKSTFGTDVKKSIISSMLKAEAAIKN